MSLTQAFLFWLAESEKLIYSSCGKATTRQSLAAFYELMLLESKNYQFSNIKFLLSYVKEIIGCLPFR